MRQVKLTIVWLALDLQRREKRALDPPLAQSLMPFSIPIHFQRCHGVSSTRSSQFCAWSSIYTESMWKFLQTARSKNQSAIAAADAEFSGRIG